MTNQFIAALHYCTDMCDEVPREAMSNYLSLNMTEGTMLDYAEFAYQLPDEHLGGFEYLREYLTIDYQRIVEDFEGEWNEFQFNGTYWTILDFRGGDNRFESSDLVDPDNRLLAAFLKEDFEILQAAIADGADLNVLPFTSRWVPLDFAFPCGVEFVTALIDAGADPCLMRSLDRDPSDLDTGNWEFDHETFNYLVALRENRRLKKSKAALTARRTDRPTPSARQRRSSI